jgi:tRNA(fMet)-specific endonuclease VapC
MRYLLDTNTISDLIKFPKGGVADRVSQLREGDLGTSIIVSAELKFGYLKKASRKLEDLVESVLASFEVAPWVAPADLLYGRLRSHLERKGTTIGQNDMLIAAHTLALDVVLVSSNEREFRRVPGLKLENWATFGGGRRM